MKRFIYPLLALLMCLTCEPASAQERTYNVLLIQSHTEHSSHSGILQESLKKGLKKEGVKANVTTEYLNADYWYYDSELFIMRRILDRARQRGTDLIVAYGDEAFYDLAHCGDTLGYELPLVVTDINYPDSATIADMPNLCGYVTKPDFDQMIDVAIQLFPKRKQLFCVTEETFLSRQSTEAVMNTWERVKGKYEGCDMKVLNVDNTTMNDIITFLSYGYNAQNYIVISGRWFPFLTLKLKSPVFIGQNYAAASYAVCAYDDVPGEDAYAAGQMAARVLKGEPADSIGLMKSNGQLLFDYKQLKYFGVDIKKAEQFGVVLNIPFADRYRFWFILFYALVVAGLVALIVWLFRSNRKEARERREAQTRLLIQQHLVEQRDEFDNIFCSIRDGLITYDTDLHIRFINRSLMQMLGLPFEAGKSRSFEGQHVSSLYQMMYEGEDILMELLNEVRSERRIIPIPPKTFLQDKNTGNYFPVSGEVVPVFANEKLAGMAIVCRNISDEEMQKWFFDMAVEESSIYPWQYDIEKQRFYFQDDWLKRIGLKGGEGGSITVDEMNNLVYADDLEHTNKVFAPILKGSKLNARVNFRMKNSQGKYEWWEFRSTTYDGLTAAAPYKILGICQSIQRYKDTEEELIKARDTALQADKLKSAFLANMSHEIRTPLNSIVGFSDLLRDFDAFSKEEIQQFIETINVNCGLLLALINDILDLSRIEAGTMEFKFAPSVLAVIYNEVYESQRLSMPEGVELKVDIPEPEREDTITTDPVRLKQVLNNLINNAKKFTTTGNITFGYVTLEGNRTQLFVSDTGKGISDEAQKHIFERFFKEDSFTQGTGLGLSICATIIERLHGTISVTSRQGEGTRFDIVIPNENE